MAVAQPPPSPRHLLGFLTGGLAAGPLSTPATGTLTFFVEITDEFFVHDGYPPFPGDNYVDKDDPINNCVEVRGEVYKNVNAGGMPWEDIGGTSDDSCTCTRIVEGSLEKSVYAVKRNGIEICGPNTPLCSPAPDVLPGDDVTFRIQYEIPSGDAENLVITDWVPLPVFNVNDPDADPLTPPSWTPSFASCPCSNPLAYPAPGHAWCGPLHTLPVNISGVTLFPAPQLSVPLAGNSLSFGYWPMFDTTNTEKRIDVLFTLTVTHEPYADGLYLGNEALECEDNTFGQRFCQAALGLVHVREPELSIKKGVIATDNSNGVFTPAPIAAGLLNGTPPGGPCPRFTAPITSANLAGLVGRDLSNVDADDWVTFAIAIENTGGAPAYEIEVSDIFPVGTASVPVCFMQNLSGLCVYDGNGASLLYQIVTQGSGLIVLKLTNPLPEQNPTGTNIAIITFDAQLIDHLQSGCCENGATLIRYTSAADTGGPAHPNFVTAGFGGPFYASAQVCVGPKIDVKCVQVTSETHTTPPLPSVGPWGTVNAAIGEIIRFRLATFIPEGTTLKFQVRDVMPGGLTCIGNPSVTFVSDFAVTTIPSWPWQQITGSQVGYGSCLGLIPFANPLPAVAVAPFVSGEDPYFFVSSPNSSTPTFDVRNYDSDANLELAIIEFNAQVGNILSNQNGVTLTNRFEVTYQDAQGNQIAIQSDPTYVRIVEPELTLTKTASPPTTQPNGTVTYTVTIAHDTSSTADAFDISFKDTLPSDLVPTGIVSCLGCSCLGSTAYWSGQDVIATCPCLKMSDTMTITYQATVSSVVQPCPKTLTNTATVTWTSLPVDGTPPGLQNLTGQSTVDDPLLQNDGERDGSDGLLGSGVLNDYQVQYSATITVQCPDLGDAPDGTNHWGFPMLACSCTAKAHFPTVYDPGLPGNAPLGPIHWSPRGLAWLGANVSGEGEADTGWDQDGFNNIQPSLGISDQDGCDDGVAAVPLSSTLSCGPGTVNFSATNPGSTQVQVYINVWFDWNCDGDWDDTIQCFDLAGVTDVWEWAVPNCLVTLNPGLNAKVTPGFLFMTPQPGQMVWMRITLTDVPVSAAGNGGPFTSPLDQGKGGSGPLGGYLYGETEDYELGPY
jgi:uncharacterized repeat protein (TIGR01451 family)